LPDSPAPDGLGINAATAKVVMEEVDDRKLLREVVAAVPPLPEREHGIEGGKAGPGRGKKTGPARLGHRTKDPCLATRGGGLGGSTTVGGRVRAGSFAAIAAAAGEAVSLMRSLIGRGLGQVIGHRLPPSAAKPYFFSLLFGQGGQGGGQGGV
jgi:hypothetical protein